MRRAVEMEKLVSVILAIALVSTSAFLMAGDADESRDAILPDGDAVVETNVTRTEVNNSIDDAIEWLFAVQKGNGGLKPWEGYSITNIGATSLAVLSWLSAGYDFTNGSVSDALDYVRSKDQGDGSYRDDTSKTEIRETMAGMVVEHLAGGNVSDSQEWMFDQADEDGVFGSTYYSQMGALRGLAWTGVSPLNGTMRMGLEHLIDEYADSADERDLAEILSVMVTCGYPRDHPFIVESIEDILSTQNPNGSWDHDISLPRFTAEIAWRLGYLGVGADNESVDRAVEYVLDGQNANGSWDGEDGTESSLLVTSAIASFTTLYVGSSGPWATAIDVQSIDLDLEGHELVGGDRVNITATPPGHGNISVEVQDPSGSTAFLWTEETAGGEADFRFTLDSDADIGTYHVYATTDNGSAVGQTTFEVVRNLTMTELVQLMLDRAAEWMFSVQHEDGGVAFDEGQADPDVIGTTMAIMIWDLAGHNMTNASYEDAFGYIRDSYDDSGYYHSSNPEFSAVQETTRGVLAEHLAGNDTSDAVGWLLSRQEADGEIGDGFRETQHALRTFLSTGMMPWNGSVVRALDYVVDNYGHSSDALKRSNVVRLMLLSGYSPSHPYIEETLDYLRDEQSGGGWSGAGTARVLMAFALAGYGDDDPTVNASVENIVDEWNEEGYWTGNYDSTGNTAQNLFLLMNLYWDDHGPYGAAIPWKRNIDLVPENYTYYQGDEVNVTTVAVEEGNVTLWAVDPEGDEVYNATVTAGGDHANDWTFELDGDAETGDYRIFAVSENGSYGQSTIEVKEVIVPEPTNYTVDITVSAPDNVTVGSNFTVTVSVRCSAEITATGALQVLDADGRALSPDIDDAIDLIENGTVNVTLAVPIPDDGEAGEYRWQTAIYTDLPSAGGYCKVRSSGTVDVIS